MKLKYTFLILGLLMGAQSQAALLQTSLAHWCVVDANGAVPAGCTAESLASPDYLNAFDSDYTLPEQPVKNIDTNLEVVPQVGSDTAKTISNMVPSVIAKTLDLRFAAVPTEWQYIHKIVYFGGAESDGQIQLPSPGFLRTAHRNHAAVLGTIFFSPDSFGGSDETNQLDYLLNPGSQINPAVVELSAIAKHYGVDGYFFNEEASYGAGATAHNAAAFMQAFNTVNPSLDMEWYFVGTSGNSTQDVLMQNNHQVASSTFIDYWLDSSINSEVPKDYPKQDIEYGFFPPSSWPLSLKDSLAQAYADHVSFSVNGFSSYLDQTISGDVSGETGFWKNAVAAGYNDQNTPSYSSNFSTAFNIGEGTRDYFVQSLPQSYGPWSDVGLQDYLPLINTTSDYTTLWDFGSAFDGDSSLQVSVNGAVNDPLPLFQGLTTPINNNTELSVTYQPSEASDDYQLCLTDNTNAAHCFPLNAEHDKIVNGWDEKQWNVNSALSGEKITSIALSNTGNSPEVIHLGRIYLGDRTELTQALASPANVQYKVVQDPSNNAYYHHIISWSPVSVPNDNNVHYRLYQDNQFVGETTQTEFDLVNQAALNSVVQVVAVNGDGVVSLR